MRANPYEQYIEHEILTAEPIRLVQLLYQGAVEAIAKARERLAQGDIKGRSAAVTKAVEILAELSASLDHTRGGQISGSLAALYDYAQRRLLDGNQQQQDQPLAEAERILQTLSEAWRKVEAPAGSKPAQQPAPPMAGSYEAPEQYVPVNHAY